ncbi:hypothetical protein C8R43DRAFT_1118887 [Mycena crocata]|nr:hypothetical protein C8R43DRAFT_1118887 [Mycena crocata]
MSGTPLARRTLRSGKEFSAFDLALGRAIAPPIHFDVAECLQVRLAEQESTGVLQFPDEDVTPFHDVPPTPPPPPAPLAATAAPPPPSLGAQARNRLKSRARRDKKRDAVREASDNPALKSINLKRVNEAKASALEVEIDATQLPHSKPAWMGSRAAGDAEFEFTEATQPHDLSSGLGRKTYTQEELDALSGTEGFRYIDWLGELTIPIVDSKRRVIAVLGGMPKDVVGWKVVTDGAFNLLQARLPRLHLTNELLHHRRAEEAYAALARGWSHGGGQTEPGELANNVANTKVTDELLAHEYFKRIAQFATILFAMWAPLLFTFYQAHLMLLAAWKPSMRRNFAGSVFAACTFNFGPRTITAPHLDFANLAWGWCAITALGEFDPDLGGHLILWDLRLVVRFPPGSTVLLPSALVRHSNVGIGPCERRASFAQYTAGGLFRWVRNGFKTDEVFEMTASREEMAARAEENASRWEEGVKMFSVIDDM